MDRTAKVDVCFCPPDGTRHPEGDSVTFVERLPFRQVVHFQKSIGWYRDEHPEADLPETLAFLSEWYMLNCIESWSLVDAKGKPLPVSRANIRERVLTNIGAAVEIADVADDLYTNALIAPLAQTASNSSRRTRTAASTSPTPGSGETRKRSRRSSTTSSPMDGIETTSISLAGASS